jgi:hypothetical protein
MLLMIKKYLDSYLDNQKKRLSLASKRLSQGI